MINVLLKKEYKKEYTSVVSTRVSNALLIGEIFGQVIIGLTCDYLGRKVAIVSTTLMIVFGGVLATAANGRTIGGMFWMMTIARGIVGFGTGGMIILFLYLFLFFLVWRMVVVVVVVVGEVGVDLILKMIFGCEGLSWLLIVEEVLKGIYFMLIHDHYTHSWISYLFMNTMLMYEYHTIRSYFSYSSIIITLASSSLISLK